MCRPNRLSIVYRDYVLSIHLLQNYGKENILQQRLFYTNEDLKNYSFINVSASIPILAWKLTKNRSHIISGTSIPEIYHILETIKGSNLMLNRQVYQRRI